MTNAETLRILRNFLTCMPKTYRQRNANYVVVRDIILAGTRTAGMTSCIEFCRELGINPFGYTLEKGAREDG